QGIGDRSCTFIPATGGASGEIKPTERTFFKDSILGGLISDTVGKGIALFRDNHVNPLSGVIENFDGDNRAAAVIEIGANFIPIAGEEKGAATIVEKVGEKFAEAATRGRKAEARILEELGLAKNTQKVATEE